MKIRNIIATALTAVLLCSCSAKKLAYFEAADDAMAMQLASSDYSIKIAPSDELMITVNSDVPEAAVAYNLPMANPAKITGDPNSKEVVEVSTQARIQTYIVSPEGYINFPVLGRIHVAGLTTRQLATSLTERLEKDIANPYVRVELVNFKVNVLGEVLKPAAIPVRGDRFTVLDALAGAGDMTVYGRRDNLLVMREENGKIQYHRLDMTDPKVVESPYYYLQQNDVVYVEPTSKRSSQVEVQNNSFKIQLVSAVSSIISVISTMVIAITR